MLLYYISIYLYFFETSWHIGIAIKDIYIGGQLAISGLGENIMLGKHCISSHSLILLLLFIIIVVVQLFSIFYITYIFKVFPLVLKQFLTYNF